MLCMSVGQLMHPAGVIRTLRASLSDKPLSRAQQPLLHPALGQDVGEGWQVAENSNNLSIGARLIPPPDLTLLYYRPGLANQ